jgi:photosystem II stability/assembly factor-like uncharacterized protein
VSGPDGSTFVILNGQLFRNNDERGDSWEKIADDVKAVAADPRNGKVLYTVDSQNHLLKSLDTGGKWITLSTGISDASLMSVYVSPANDQDVYVGTSRGLFRTSDAGFTWRATSFTQPVGQVYVNHRSPSYQYLLSVGIVYVSSDGGNTWKKSETGLPVELVRGTGRTASKAPCRTSLLAFVDWEKPFLLAATYNKGVFRSDDNGASWRSASVGFDAGTLATSAFVASKQVVLVSPDVLYSSTDCITWRKLPVVSGRNIIGSFLGAIGNPRRDGLFLNFRFDQDKGDTRRLGYRDPNGILIGLNYGVTPHSEIDSLWVGQRTNRPVIFAVTANLTDIEQNQRYARPTFVSASQDGGYSWEFIGKLECGSSAASPRGLQSTVWVYGDLPCVHGTQDGGVTWGHLSGFEFPYSNAAVSSIQFDPKNYSVAYYCSGVNEYYLYRYQLDSATKVGQATNLKVIAWDVLADEANPSVLFTDTAHVSSDGGWTWTDKSPSLTKFLGSVPPLSTRTLKLVSFRNAEIRAVIGQFNRMSGGGIVRIIRSQDSGSSWSAVATIDSRSPEFAWDKWPRVLRNSNDPSNFFVVAFVPFPSQHSNMLRLLETKDDGVTWHEIYSCAATERDVQRETDIIRAVAQSQEGQKRILYVGGRHGLWKSVDEGKTWNKSGGVQ